MGEPLPDWPLTAEERRALARWRQGPQSLHELAETLGLTLEQTQRVIPALHRNVGLVRLFRSPPLRYGLAE